MSVPPVLLVSSAAGVYCATKFAVRSISDTLRVELAPFNIKVRNLAIILFVQHRSCLGRNWT